MCPDCGCDLTNSYISCPNCGRELVKIHYKATPQPVPSDEFRESNFGLSSYQNELKRQNDLLEEQNRLLKSIDASQKTTAAYTMLNVFWH